MVQRDFNKWEVWIVLGVEHYKGSSWSHEHKLHLHSQCETEASWRADVCVGFYIKRQWTHCARWGKSSDGVSSFFLYHEKHTSVAQNFKPNRIFCFCLNCVCVQAGVETQESWKVFSVWWLTGEENFQKRLCCFRLWHRELTAAEQKLQIFGRFS